MLLFIKHNHCHHHRVLGFFVVIAMLYTEVSVLVLGIGQYYWVLDIGCLSWYHSNTRKYLGNDCVTAASKSRLALSLLPSINQSVKLDFIAA